MTKNKFLSPCLIIETTFLSQRCIKNNYHNLPNKKDKGVILLIEPKIKTTSDGILKA